MQQCLGKLERRRGCCTLRRSGFPHPTNDRLVIQRPEPLAPSQGDLSKVPFVSACDVQPALMYDFSATRGYCCDRGAIVSDVCSLSIPSRHIGVFIRWRMRHVGTDGRAGLFCVCTGGAGRLPGQEAVADRWPQPRRGDGRECIEPASERAPALRRATFGRPRDPKNRQYIESASERASACAGLYFLRAREAASPLFFFVNPVGGERWSSEELRGRCRRLAGAAAS